MSTGGNWMSDGAELFSSELLLMKMMELVIMDRFLPKSYRGGAGCHFSSWMGIDEYIKMTVLPYDDIHHIDMHMKLLDEETLLIGEYPQGLSDGPQIEANIQYVLSNFNTKLVLLSR